MTGTRHAHSRRTRDLIRNGEIDTVLMVFPDLQGRLVGKRTTGRFFLQSVADAGTENCDYLIACDMDNNPVPGLSLRQLRAGLRRHARQGRLEHRPPDPVGREDGDDHVRPARRRDAAS